VVQIKTSLRARQNDGTRIITKEEQRETTGMFGHDPDNLHKQHRAETQRDGEQVYRL
jgi:hypothetical protein